MKYQQAVTALEKKRENKFILKGSEPYLKKHFIMRTKIRFPLYKVFFPEDQSEAFNVMGSGNFFENPAVILIRFDEMDADQFAPLIKSYDECIVASLSEKVKKPSIALTKAISLMKIVECSQLRDYGNDFSLWISTKIAAAGYTAPGKVDDLIYARVGPNMSVIASELKKLFLVKADSKIITENDVALYVSQTSVSTSFQLFEYLMRKDVKRALECFDSHTRNHTTFIDIIAFVGSYLERMYRMLLLKEDGSFDINDIADIIGLPPFIVRTKYMPKALAFGKNRIAQKIDEVCQLGVKSRLFRGDQRVLMENFILDFK